MCPGIGNRQGESFPFQPSLTLKVPGWWGPCPPPPPPRPVGSLQSSMGQEGEVPANLPSPLGKTGLSPPRTGRSGGHWPTKTDLGSRGPRSKPDKPVGQAESGASGSEFGEKPPCKASATSTSRPSAKTVSPGTREGLWRFLVTELRPLGFPPTRWLRLTLP